MLLLDPPPVPLMSHRHLIEQDVDAVVSYLYSLLAYLSGLPLVELTDIEGRQPLDATLTALADLATVADSLPYFIGVDDAALAPFTALARTLLAGATPAAMHSTLGLGSMATQNANAVSITGGSAIFTGALSADSPTLMVDNTRHTVGIGDAPQIDEKLLVTGMTFLNGHVGLNSRPTVGNTVTLRHIKAGTYGLSIYPNDTDTGPGQPINFHNLAGTSVGMIVTTASGTSYATTSDVRLKRALAPLTGALACICALQPVSFRFTADDSPGEGFLAHELQAHIPTAVTGTPDAMDAHGNIAPQAVDHSKIVPHLVAAVQELTAQVQTLTARVTTLEAQRP